MLTIDKLYQQLKNVGSGSNICSYSLEKCKEIFPLIEKINQLKNEKNAIVLAHSYVSPEIIYGVADFVGDSYKLSKDAKNTTADIIIFSAVKFMAETAKILNPQKRVFIPSKLNGCTLADGISAQDVQKFKQQYPDYTYVCYINTTAAVKAECDVCVTSTNIYDIVEKIPNDKIFFLPDKLMGENLINEMKRRHVHKQIRIADATCYVHEEYDPEMIDYLRLEYDNPQVLAHPECKQEVVNKSDYTGSTSQIINYVKSSSEKNFLILSECGLVSRLQVEYPQKNMIGSCQMCRYMKSNSLESIYQVLTTLDKTTEIKIANEERLRAEKCIEAMFTYTEKEKIFAKN